MSECTCETGETCPVHCSYILKLEAEVEQLRYERAQAGKRAMTLEAENKRLMGDFETIYKTHRAKLTELSKLREAVGNLLNDNSPQNREDVYALLEANDNGKL